MFYLLSMLVSLYITGCVVTYALAYSVTEDHEVSLSLVLSWPRSAYLAWKNDKI